MVGTEVGGVRFTAVTGIKTKNIFSNYLRCKIRKDIYP